MSIPDLPPVESASSSNREIVSSAFDVLEGKSKKGRLARLLPFLGPAFIASVAYVDPGNYATNIAAGARYGYLLLWVILASNLAAMVIQSLSAKLGIASGKNLAEVMRDHYPPWARYLMWVMMELVAMATDLAEFLGAALGLYLLFPGLFLKFSAVTRMPALLLPAILAGVVTFLILALERSGFRSLEIVITGFVGVIAFSYLVETLLESPDWGQIVYHTFVPGFNGTESILLACGILGATVMPHAIFLHSGLTQGRIVTREPKLLQRLYRFELMDVGIAMGLAGLVNMGMLIMAASTFYYSGLQHVATIEEAYKTLTPLLGIGASFVFALSLFASGQSSAAVGTMAGQIMMQGFVHWQIPVWLRRALTMLPAFVVIAMRLDPTRTLVISQVLLSFGLPFAVIPLVVFTNRQKIMGVLVNRRSTTVIASIIAVLIVGLNLFLLYNILVGGGV
jgi:manganese transport protein